MGTADGSHSVTSLTVTLADPGDDIEMKAIAYILSVLKVMPISSRSRIMDYVGKRLHGEL